MNFHGTTIMKHFPRTLRTTSPTQRQRKTHLFRSYNALIINCTGFLCTAHAIQSLTTCDSESYAISPYIDRLCNHVRRNLCQLRSNVKTNLPSSISTVASLMQSCASKVFPPSFRSFFTTLTEFSLNSSMKLFNTFKWNVGAISFLWERHL